MIGLATTATTNQTTQNADYLRDWFAGASAIIALVALGIAAYNLWQSKRRDRRDLFINVHRALLEPDVVAGRRLLYLVKSQAVAETMAANAEQSGQIYRALAMFDLLALYAEEAWIDEKTVAKEWRYSLVNTHPGAQLWIAERYRDREQWHSWEHYQNLVKRLSVK